MNSSRAYRNGKAEYKNENQHNNQKLSKNKTFSGDLRHSLRTRSILKIICLSFAFSFVFVDISYDTSYISPKFSFTLGSLAKPTLIID